MTSTSNLRRLNRATYIGIDSSETSHLVTCSRCAWLAGPYPYRVDAVEAALIHIEHHTEETKIATAAAMRAAKEALR